MRTNPTSERPFAHVHGLMLVQTLVVLAVSLNRLDPWTLGYVASNQFLRWVDLINMLPLPILSVVAFYLLKKYLEGNTIAGATVNPSFALSLIFLIGVYLVGVNYGDHEVTNYIHIRFCANDSASDLCRIIIYNDDEFTHYVFFTGFVMTNAAIMFIQARHPFAQIPQSRDLALIAFNAIFIALGIFANLAFEDIGLDLYVVALLALIALVLLLRHKAQPIIIYYAIAYGLGLIATFAYKGYSFT